MNRYLGLAACVVLMIVMCGCTGGDEEKADTAIPVDPVSLQTTVVSFTKAVANGQGALALKYIHPESHEYGDIKETLTAAPGSPEYAGKVMFEAIDTEAPMPVVKVTAEEDGVAVVWRVTFKHSFKIEGVAFKKGDTYNLDATLRQLGDQWLIYGL